MTSVLVTSAVASVASSEGLVLVSAVELLVSEFWIASLSPMVKEEGG